MERLTRLTAAMVLALTAYFAHSLSWPERVAACSCAMPFASLEELAADGATIFSGTVGALVGDSYAVGVEAWYHGPGAADVVWVRSGQISDGQGGVTFDTCSIALSTGERRFFTVHGRPPDPFSASNCSPNALLDADQGRALVAEAFRAFGGPQPIPSTAPEPSAPVDFDPWLGALPVLALAGLAGLVLFGSVYLLARRDPPA